jgi:hypothetical protein
LKNRFLPIKPLHGVIGVVVAMALVLGAFVGVALADQTVNVKHATLDNHQGNCSASNGTVSLWHFVITDMTDATAPANIHVFWDTPADQDVTLQKVAGGSAHYETTDHAGSLVTDATAVVPDDWAGQFNLSHVTCTPTAAQPLTAEKTANTSYTRDYGWDITKSADPTEHTGAAGDPGFQSDYNVNVDQTITESAFAVSGDITVTNTNPTSASFSVSDLVGGTPASVDCGGGLASGTVAANSTATCSYSVGPLASKPNDGTNVATITSNTPGIDGTTASAAYAFGDPTTTTGDTTVNVTDNFNNTGDVSLGSADGDKAFDSYSRDFACPTDASAYQDGNYKQEFPNTATITETGDYADANFTVNCTLPPLTVEKTAAGTYNHDISWDLTKSANPTTFNGIAGQMFNPTGLWDVNATKTEADSGYKVEGDITIANPAAIPQTFTNVSDQLNTNGTPGIVDCDPNTVGDQVSAQIAAGSSVTCKYTASPGDASATQNTATVSATGNADVMADAPVSFSPNVHGDVATTLGDARFNFSQGISSTTEQKFNDSFACPSNNSSKYVNNQYSFDVKNTATLKGDNTDLSAYAKVTVNCVRTRVPGEGTMGFWQNKNGQDLIKNGTSPSGPVPAVPCATAVSQLRAYNPFLDLSSTATCTQLQTYVTNVIKAANASGTSMNAMLKAQMLTTALDVTYGKISGGANVDLTAIPKPVTSSTYENTSSVFGGNTCRSVSNLLTDAASQSNVGGSNWYANVKATQELAKDTFDAINNHAVFTCA